nr:acyl-CoA dehydrogenase family protein [Sphingomonas sp. CDS-1]
MDNMLLDPFVRLLGDSCTPQQIRALEAGGSSREIWAAFEESGFLNALVAEEAGGFGLAFSEVAPLFLALGSHAVPVPVAETMVARALLGAAGVALPEGAIVLANPSGVQGGLISAATLASHVLADLGDRLALFDIGQLDVTKPMIHGSLAAHIAIPPTIPAQAEIERPEAGLRAVAAVLRAAQIVGAARRVLDMTVAYAGERVQFGKPIGKQQAIQQNLAVMAEQAVMANMAAQMGCAEGIAPRIEVAAIAKQITSAAAVEIANMAHAVHGAIGISEEYDLQLFTRRLHEWRMADVSEGWWAGILGHRRLLSEERSSIDYIRTVEAVA